MSVLSVGYSAAVNIEGHVCFQILVFSGYMPRSGIAGSYGSSTFSFCGTSILFSIVTAPIYILNNSVGGFPFQNEKLCKVHVVSERLTIFLCTCEQGRRSVGGIVLDLI